MSDSARPTAAAAGFIRRSLRFLSDSLRGIGDSSAEFDAFISYSRVADAAIAAVLQRGLQQFAKPWYRLRILHVFRDDVSLFANPGLWSSILQALKTSRYFILLASPKAAESEWVAKEVEEWLQDADVARLLIVLTDGELSWDEAAGDFDWTANPPLPTPLRGVFPEEPRYVDLRWIRSEEHLSLRNPRFREALADLAAPIRDCRKEELFGEDVRQHRRAMRLARGAAAALAALTAAAITAAVLAVGARNDARAQARLALARQFAAQSDAFLRSRRLDLGLLLAAQSYHSAPTGESLDALVTALLAAPHVTSMLWDPPITAVHFTPGAPWLTVLHGSRDIDVWNLETRHRVATLEAQAVPTSAAVSTDGRRIAIGFDDGRIEIHLVKGGAHAIVLTTPSSPPALIPLPTTSAVRDLEFSPDGRLLAWTAGYRLAVWDGRAIRIIPLTGAFRNDWTPAFTGDGRLLAAIGGTPPQITAWRLGPGGPVVNSARTFFTVPGTDPRFANLGYSLSSSNPSLVAIGHFDGTASIWNLATAKQVARLRGGNGPVVRVAFSSDGRFVVGVDNDGIRLWQVSNGKPVKVDVPAFGTDVSLAFLPKGHVLAAVGTEGAVTLDDLDTVPNQVATTLPSPNAAEDAVAVSPDGGLVAAWTSHNRIDATVDIWNLRSRRLLGSTTFNTEGDTMNVAARADGTIAVWTGTQVEFWNARTHTTERHIRIAGIDDLAFAQNGDPIVGVFGRPHAFIEDVARGGPRVTLPGSPNQIRISPDGRRVALSDSDHAWLADARSGQRVGPVVTGTAPRFSSDGRTLAIPTYRGTVRVEDARNGRTGAVVDVGPHFEIDDVAPSGDGRLLAVVGGTFGGGPLGTLRTNELELWDVRRNVLLGSGSLAAGLPTTRSIDVRFAGPTGPLVATGLGGVAVLNVDPNHWLARACAIVGRTLTRSEWASLVGSTTYDPACRR